MCFALRSADLERLGVCAVSLGDSEGVVIYRIPPKLWLVRNEVGGWTAMYPDDY